MVVLSWVSENRHTAPKAQNQYEAANVDIVADHHK